MTKVDLHLHSYYSDGEHSPEEIIKVLIKYNVSIFSLTEHNIVVDDRFGIKDFSNQYGLKFVEGVEISTLDRDLNQSFHVLGYAKNFEKIKLNQRLRTTIEGYNLRAEKIINKLNTKFPFIDLNFNNIKSASQEAYISRNTLARLLVDGLNGSLTIKEALREYVFVEENDNWMLSPVESFNIIKLTGGIPVLAHSGGAFSRLGPEVYENLIRKFIGQGLEGIEVYYSHHSMEEISALKNIALRYGLLITAGSDWHGVNYTPLIKPGLEISSEELEKFLARVL